MLEAIASIFTDDRTMIILEKERQNQLQEKRHTPPFRHSRTSPKVSGHSALKLMPAHENQRNPLKKKPESQKPISPKPQQTRRESSKSLVLPPIGKTQAGKIPKWANEIHAFAPQLPFPPPPSSSLISSRRFTRYRIYLSSNVREKIARNRARVNPKRITCGKLLAHPSNATVSTNEPFQNSRTWISDIYAPVAVFLRVFALLHSSLYCLRHDLRADPLFPSVL